MFLIAFSCQGYKGKNGKNFFTPFHPAYSGKILPRKAGFEGFAGRSALPLKKAAGLKHAAVQTENAQGKRPVRLLIGGPSGGMKKQERDKTLQFILNK